MQSSIMRMSASQSFYWFGSTWLLARSGKIRGGWDNWIQEAHQNWGEKDHPQTFFGWDWIKSRVMKDTIKFSTKKSSSVTIWLVVWNIFYFPIYKGNFIIPIDVHIFQRGGPTTNQQSIGMFITATDFFVDQLPAVGRSRRRVQRAGRFGDSPSR